MPVKECVSCSQPIPHTALFCTLCGTKQTNTSSPSPSVKSSNVGSSHNVPSLQPVQIKFQGDRKSLADAITALHNAVSKGDKGAGVQGAKEVVKEQKVLFQNLQKSIGPLPLFQQNAVKSANETIDQQMFDIVRTTKSVLEGNRGELSQLTQYLNTVLTALTRIEEAFQRPTVVPSASPTASPNIPREFPQNTASRPTALPSGSSSPVAAKLQAWSSQINSSKESKDAEIKRKREELEKQREEEEKRRKAETEKRKREEEERKRREESERRRREEEERKRRDESEKRRREEEERQRKAEERRRDESEKRRREEEERKRRDESEKRRREEEERKKREEEERKRRDESEKRRREEEERKKAAEAQRREEEKKAEELKKRELEKKAKEEKEKREEEERRKKKEEEERRERMRREEEEKRKNEEMNKKQAEERRERERREEEERKRNAEEERKRREETERRKREEEKKREEERKRREMEERTQREEEERRKEMEVAAAKQKQEEERREREKKEEEERKKKELELKKKAEDERKERERKDEEARKAREMEEQNRLKKQQEEERAKAEELERKKKEENKIKRDLILQKEAEEKAKKTPLKKKRHSKIIMEGSVVDSATEALSLEGLEKAKKPPERDLAGGGTLRGKGNQWEQRMQQKANEEKELERQRIRGRRAGGVQYMDQQIRKLISEIQQMSGGSGGGLGTVSYGDLFVRTQKDMSALSAVLSVAKKRGVVSFNGTMLMQGVDDGVQITLLKSEIEDTPVFKSVRIDPVDLPKAQGPEKCLVCSKTVYPTERIAPNKKVMHKACFRCQHCQGILKLAAFAYNDRSGKFYCEPHFKELFNMHSGYNF